MTGQETLAVLEKIQQSYKATEIEQWCPRCQKVTVHLRATCDNPANGGAFRALECRNCMTIRISEVPDYEEPGKE